VRVVISTHLVGHEIDLESPILQQMYNAGTFDVCQRAGTSHSTINFPNPLLTELHRQRRGSVWRRPREWVCERGGIPGITGGGFLTKPGFQCFHSYEDFSLPYSQVTRCVLGGILAATLNDTHVGSWSIPGTVQMQGSRPKGISDTYSMSQQGEFTHSHWLSSTFEKLIWSGFTADVSCAVQTLTNDTTSPTVSWYIDSVKKWGTDLPRPNITYINVSSNCTSIPPVLSRFPSLNATNTHAHVFLVNMTDAYVSADGEYLWAVGCDPTPEASNNYSTHSTIPRVAHR
jgi:hypothetical protein